MTIFISVISHNNTTDIIETLRPHRFKEIGAQVIVRNNLTDQKLRQYCNAHDIHYVENTSTKGFGENHNLNFKLCNKSFNLTDDDYYIVINPDIIIEPSDLHKLTQQMQENSFSITAPDLYKDIQKTIRDDSIRNFPNLLNIISRYTINSNNTIIDRSTITKPKQYDWASGALLAFKAKHYQALDGFDEKYFMYYEDVDICWRSAKTGKRLIYLPDIKAIHIGQRASRNGFSIYLYWHIKSALRFCLKKLIHQTQTRE